MIVQQNRLFRVICRFSLHGVLYCGMMLTVTPVATFAVTDAPPRTPAIPPATDERNQRSLRIPPQAAIDVCEGKHEGDPCTFISAQGSMNGECLSGVENIFACRPHRGGPPSEAGASRQPRQTEKSDQETIPARRPDDRAAPLPETGQRHTAESATVKRGEPSPDRQTGTQAVPSGQKAPVIHDQAGQAHPAAPAPVSSEPQHTDSIDTLGQYTGFLGIGLVVALIAAGLTWYGFFRYSTVPLRRLRKVTQQLAGGDLAARVGEGLVNRKDEVADLGRDVDRMAERIESLVGAHQRLIRDVSHELRSPLARLNVALELARQSAGPALSAPFDRIERESDRLNELIGQLLILTKLESESGMIQRTELDLVALIAEVVEDVDFESRNTDRRVVMTPSKPLILRGNRELLRQALENLVRNAARYTAEGTAVEISLSRKEFGGRGLAHIEVRDHGPGVPESELADIFRPFYRVNDARERQSGGTGVGLAISDRAVRLHGGSLRASNAPDSGLIMELELPLG